MHQGESFGGRQSGQGDCAGTVQRHGVDLFWYVYRPEHPTRRSVKLHDEALGGARWAADVVRKAAPRDVDIAPTADGDCRCVRPSPPEVRGRVEPGIDRAIL